MAIVGFSGLASHQTDFSKTAGGNSTGFAKELWN